MKYGLVSEMDSEPIEVPHDPGNFFTFRPVAGKRLKRAAAYVGREQLEDHGERTIAAIRNMTADDEDEVKETAAEDKKKDPLSEYSDTIFLRYGLVAWTGPHYENHDVAGTPNDPDLNKDDLDPKTRRWAFEQIGEISNLTEGEVESSGAGTDSTPVESEPPAAGQAPGGQSQSGAEHPPAGDVSLRTTTPPATKPPKPASERTSATSSTPRS